jgi:hypothetical protein
MLPRFHPQAVFLALAVMLAPRLTLAQDEAGDALATALRISGNPDGTTPLPAISGVLDPDDCDIFYFRIADPSVFSATTVGTASFNTQLFLFNESGVGITMNDDDPLSASPQSRLSSTFIPLSPGNYYLAITPSDKDPLDKAGMELWNDLPPTTERSPDGPGAPNPLHSWSSSPLAAGAYTISLTGATAVPGKPAPVPACLAGWFAFDDGACDNMGGKEQTSNYAAGGGSNGTYGPPGSGPTDAPNAFASSALFFDGIDDYIDVPNYNTATITSGQAGSFSAMAWINPDAAASTSGNMTILDTKGAGSVGYRFFLRPASGLCGSTAWELALELGLGGTASTIASGICIGKSNWSNVAVTASWGSAASVTPSIRFYTSRNAAGLSQQTTPATTSMPNLPGNNASVVMRIGARSGTPSEYFMGLMDEVMLFKCAISPSVIQGIQAAGAAGVSKVDIQAPWEFASLNESTINIPITIFNSSTDTKTFDLFYAPAPRDGLPYLPCNIDGFFPATFLPPFVVMPPRSSQTVWLHLNPDFRFEGHACYSIRAIDRQTGQTYSDTGTVVDFFNWWASIPPTTDPLIRVVPVGGTINFPFVLRNTGPLPRTIQYKVHALDADTWSMNSPIRIQIPGSPPGNPVFGNALVLPESELVIPVSATLLNQPGVALIHEIALFADVNGDETIAFEEDLASMAVRASSLPLDPCVYGGHGCACVADFDDGSGNGYPDCGVTIDDLLYYLVIFENGVVFADIDDGSGTGVPDGGVTIDDLLYYLLRFEQGC